MKKLTFLIVCFVGLILPLKSSVAQHFDYTFEGDLKAELSNNLQNKGNPSMVDLSGVEVRVVRRHGTNLRGKSADAVTGPDGSFTITKQFARDRDGALPGRKPIRFQVDVRFRNDNLKVRKGGWGKVNWYTVAHVNEIDGGTNDLGNLVFNGSNDRDLGNQLAADHAQIYWIHQKAIDEMESKGLEFPNRVSVTYPHKNIFKGKDAGFAITNSFLGEDDNPRNSDEPRTMMHELIHVWHVQNLRGNATIKCLVDGHHNDPDKLFPSRCSGFTEGLAEAVGWQIAQDLFGYRDQEPNSMWELRNANAGKPYELNDIQDAQRSDLGWKNMFRFVIVQNEWSPFNSINAADVPCNPSDLSPYEILGAIDNASPKPGQMTIARMANMMEEQTSLSTKDAKIYQLLGNPTSRAKEIINQECGSSSKHTVVIAGNGISGETDYTIKGGGNLTQVEKQMDGFTVTKQSNDEVNGTTANGKVVEGNDGFEVSGDIPSIHLEDPTHAMVFVDGKPRHTIVIASDGISGSTDYTLEGGGTIKQVQGTLAGVNVTKQSNDNVNGSSANGHVGGGNDGFVVYGDLPSIQIDNQANAKVYVDVLAN